VIQTNLYVHGNHRVLLLTRHRIQRNLTYIERRPHFEMIPRFLVAAAVLGLLLVQQLPAQAPPPDRTDTNAPPITNATSGPLSPQWKGLTVKEKLAYDWRHLFDPEHVVFAAIGAGVDQLRERPGEWGDGWDAYGTRFASHIGYYITQRSIMFPVQAVDHEDARYFPSNSKTYKGRLGHALLHTVWRHNDSGSMMPAYSEFLGDYGAAAVSRLWWPQRFHTASAIFIAGSDTVLVDAGINVFHEFTPDIKRWLHLGH
jgi:hypothetical protein